MSVGNPSASPPPASNSQVEALLRQYNLEFRFEPSLVLARIEMVVNVDDLSEKDHN